DFARAIAQGSPLPAIPLPRHTLRRHYRARATASKLSRRGRGGSPPSIRRFPATIDPRQPTFPFASAANALSYHVVEQLVLLLTRTTIAQAPATWKALQP